MKQASSFFRLGHWPTLLSSFLYFDTSFMIWVLFGPLSVLIAKEYHLSPVQAANLVAIPTLSGSILRVIFGWLGDRIGQKRTGQLGMLVTAVPLVWGWKFAHSVSEFTAIAVLLGVAGASFAVALPLASKWYPKSHQGLVLGICGAGNSGTIFATLFANRLAAHFHSWHAVFGLALIPLTMVLLIFTVCARQAKENAQEPVRLSSYLELLRTGDTWIFCLCYWMTFGGFVGMTTYLTLFFHTQYALDAIQSSDFATICVIAGNFVRPVGGWLADRFGGIRVILALYASIFVLLVAASRLLPLKAETVVLFFLMLSFGLGNGALFQLVPLRFPALVGLATGFVGAFGGIGGYVLPKLLAACKAWSGSYADGFLLLTILPLVSIALVLWSKQRWESTFVGLGGRANRDGIFGADEQGVASS
ncbi:nitrate/nitrite transporter [Alicyclobacillus mali (ex Roth et al. 2021)]|uniref:nitrate/nitrite transporter n=1 Tax=Alicyclobacillus mali (ex Roth et al. 2021) TaxID=1123961 RepID=UPI0023F26F1B|nr:nitrate/nitrite transporter [Alicyclobacillus mali (ex Roth et al. 2021)]